MYLLREEIGQYSEDDEGEGRANCNSRRDILILFNEHVSEVLHEYIPLGFQQLAHELFAAEW